MFTFIELEGFTKRRADLISDDDYRAMQEALIVNPELGSVIQGTGGFRKLRWAKESTGKSGGKSHLLQSFSVNGQAVSRFDLFEK